MYLSKTLGSLTYRYVSRSHSQGMDVLSHEAGILPKRYTPQNEVFVQSNAVNKTVWSREQYQYIHIYLNKDVVSTATVRKHLARFGLICKDSESPSAQVLGLEIWGKQGNLQWKWESDMTNDLQAITQRSVFLMSGWLHVSLATGIIKHWISSVMQGWDNKVDNVPCDAWWRKLSPEYNNRTLLKESGM